MGHKLVIGIAQDSLTRITGYRLVDTSNDKVENVDLKNIDKHLDSIMNFEKPGDSIFLEEKYGKESKYPVLTTKWRVNRNKETKVAFWKPDDAVIKLYSYSGVVEYCELS